MYAVGGERWNVILVSYEGEERKLLKELEGVGEFKTVGFRSILLGRVENLDSFLEILDKRMPNSLSRVIPVEETFHASPDTLLEVLKAKVERFADRIEVGETFCVRFERRGFKGLISSKEVERELGDHLYHLLERQAKNPRVDLEDPDKIVSVQQLGNLLGIGLIDRRLRERHPYVRVK